MSAVQTTIKLNDMMSPSLRRMMKTMSDVIAEFEEFQDVADNAWDSSKADEMRRKMDSVGSSVRNLQNGMQDYADETNTATKATGELESAIGRVATAIGGIMGVKQIADWVSNSLESANVENSAKAQLEATMKNMGNSSDYDRVLKKADEIQQAGIYGNEAMIKAGAEFATYVTDTDAIELMMDTLTDYMAGMTGGGAVGAEEAVNYATNIGKIMTGSFDAMTKKGFQFTDAQKAVVKGTATEAQYIEALGRDYKKLSTDMQKATVINQVIAESWDGMYEAMSNTPEASIIQMQNAWGDMQEEIGNQLYPAVAELFSTIQAHIPEIQAFLSEGIGYVSSIIEKATELVGWLAENRDTVKDILENVGLIAGAYLSVKVALMACQEAQQIFNTLSDANPWILLATIVAMLVGSLVAGQYATVGMQNKIRDMWLGILTYGNLAWEFLTNAGQSVLGFWSGVVTSIGSFVAGAVSGVVSGIDTMISYIYGKISDFLSFLGIAESSTFSYLSDKFGEYAEEANGVRKEAVDYFNNDAFAMLNEANNNMASLFGGGDTYDKALVNANNQMQDMMNRFNIQGGSESYTPTTTTTEAQGTDWKEYYNNHFRSQRNDTIANDISDIKTTTGGISKSLDVSNEDLKYLRDIAERDTINRFTTAEIKVDMNNNNTISSNMDIDGVVSYLEGALYDAMVSTAEAVHV